MNTKLDTSHSPVIIDYSNLGRKYLKAHLFPLNIHDRVSRSDYTILGHEIG